jgi:hypothetical protein
VSSISAPREFARGRNVREIPVTGHPGELQKDAHGAARLEPIRAEGSHGRQIDGATVHFAALHGKEDRAAVGIAADDFDVESDGVAQDHGDVIARRALGAAAENERRTARPARILDRGRRRVRSHHQQIGIFGKARRRAQPGESARVELDAGTYACDREERHVA